MAELDRQKEKVSFWRTLFFIWLTTILGLISYLFTHYKKLDFVEIILVNVAIFIVVILLIFTSKVMIKEIDKLKDL